jgi:hypothetical protein
MRSIFGYLEQVNDDEINELYSSSWCALAVFQSLNGISKQ